MSTENEWAVPRFWFEGNNAWGWVETRADWYRIVNAYTPLGVSESDLMKSKRGPDQAGGDPSYGDMVPGSRPGTLADHFAGQS